MIRAVRFISIVVSLIVAAVPPATALNREAFEGRVVPIVDGDTMEVLRADSPFASDFMESTAPNTAGVWNTSTPTHGSVSVRPTGYSSCARSRSFQPSPSRKSFSRRSQSEPRTIRCRLRMAPHPRYSDDPVLRALESEARQARRIVDGPKARHGSFGDRSSDTRH